MTAELNAFIYSVEAPQVTAGVGSTIGIGAQTREQWQREIDTLGDLKVTKGKPRVDDLYDNSFVERSLKDGKVVWP